MMRILVPCASAATIHDMLNKMLCLLLLLFITSASLANEQAEDVSLSAVSILLEQGQDAQALAMLQQLVTTSPDNFQAWFFLGAEQARRRRFHDAIESFRKVIDLQPELAEPHNNLAVIYNELGDLRSAVVELEASLKLNPDYATAHENIGDMYVKLAAESYQKALEKNPNQPLRNRYEYLLHIRNVKAVAPAAQESSGVKPELADAQESDVAEKTESVERTAPQGPSASPEKQAEEDTKQTAAVPIKAEAEGHSESPVKAAVEERAADAEEKDIQKDAAARESAEIAVASNETSSKLEKPAAPEKQAAAETVDKQLGVTDQHGEEKAVLQAIEAWRTAWNKRDALAYFAAYDADFKQGKRFLSHNDWIGYKLQVIIKKKYIDVSLENIQVRQISEDLAEVVFLQHYRSDVFVSDDRKKLRLKKTANGWKIIHEQSM